MHKLLPTLVLSLVVSLASCANEHRSFLFAQEAEPVDTVPEVVTTRLSLVFAGDLMQHMPQINAARTKGGDYDYTECFEHIRPQIEYADIAVANFETTLAGAPYSGYPTFCAPDAFLRDVKAAGFDVLLTANNHTCDRGQRGIERTIAMMDSLQIPHLGSYVSEAARQQQYPYVFEREGIRLAFLNYTYGTNGIPVPKGNVVNRIDREQIARDIAAAKAKHPDVIIAFMHWGEEYHPLPVDSQRELADWLFAQGVDHVIGGHPHVVEPMEIRTDSLGQKHVLAYSLGNFVSNQSRQGTVGGMLVHMTLEKDSTTRLSACDYSLYFVTRPGSSGHKQHRIYDANTPDSVLNKSERNLRDNFLSATRALFQKHNKNVSERKK